MAGHDDQSSGFAVTVVIPTFNRGADLIRALDALALQTTGRPKVIIVDNSSSDDTEARVDALMPDWNGRLRYIRKSPKGPSSARNTGLAAADTRYVLFQDSDIALPPDWIANALTRLRADQALGAVGGYILYAFEDNCVNAYGGDMGRFGLAWDVDEGTDLDPAKGPAERIWINCSAMLADADAVRLAGGFDETFFYGYEDSDLGWRLNLTGHRVAVFPELRARHHVDPDPGSAHAEIVFHYCKNRLRTILKNAAGCNLGIMLTAYAAYTVADLLLRGPRQAKVRALIWNMTHLGETISLRRELQRHRKASDHEVMRRGSGRWLPPTPLAGRRRRPAGDKARSTRQLSDKPMVDDRV